MPKERPGRERESWVQNGSTFIFMLYVITHRGLVRKGKFQNLLFWQWVSIGRLVPRRFCIAGPGKVAQWQENG